MALTLLHFYFFKLRLYVHFYRSPSGLQRYLPLIVVLKAFTAVTAYAAPVVILRSPGEPDMAIFDKPNQQALLLGEGCERIYTFWDAVPISNVSANEYRTKLINQHEVVDLPCNDGAKVRKFQSAGEHGSIVVTPRGSNKSQRHYVNPSKEWHAIFPGDVVATTVNDLFAVAPKVGPDLNFSQKRPWCLWLSARSPSSDRYIDKRFASDREAAEEAQMEQVRRINSLQQRRPYVEFESDILAVTAYECPCKNVFKPSGQKRMCQP